MMSLCSNDIPELDLEVESVLVNAQERKLKHTVFRQEVGGDGKCYAVHTNKHGVETWFPLNLVAVQAHKITSNELGEIESIEKPEE